MLKSGDCSKCGPAVLERFGRSRENLIPLLHAMQETLGCLNSEAVREAAEWLDIPVSEVYGTATFYTLFSLEPKGRYVVRLCDSPPCHIEGARKIRRAVEKSLGIKAGGTTEDGLFSFEIVSCLGLCGVAPAVMVNGDVYGNLTPEAVPGILDKYREG